MVYPRVCGGTLFRIPGSSGAVGLSPRVRGNRGAGASPVCGHGSIPACAGEPHISSDHSSPLQVYPRVCGGTTVLTWLTALERGLSPRVRGNLGQIA